MSSVMPPFILDIKEDVSTDKAKNEDAEQTIQSTCQTFAPVPVVQATSCEVVNPANASSVLALSSPAQNASKAVIVKTTSNLSNNLTDIDPAVAEFHAELHKEYIKAHRFSHVRSKSDPN